MLEGKIKKFLIFFLLFVFLFQSAYVFAFEVKYPSVPGAINPQEIEQKLATGEITENQVLPLYFKYFFNLFLIIAVLICLGVIIYGGVLHIVAGAKPVILISAKQWVFSGLLGLLILFSSYLVLITINPQLTVLKLPVTQDQPPGPSPTPPSPGRENIIYQEFPIGTLVERILAKNITCYENEDLIDCYFKTNIPESEKYAYLCYDFDDNGNFIDTDSEKDGIQPMLFHDRLDCLKEVAQAIKAKGEKLKEKSEQLKNLTQGCDCENCECPYCCCLEEVDCGNSCQCEGEDCSCSGDSCKCSVSGCASSSDDCSCSGDSCSCTGASCETECLANDCEYCECTCVDAVCSCADASCSCSCGDCDCDDADCDCEGAVCEYVKKNCACAAEDCLCEGYDCVCPECVCETGNPGEGDPCLSRGEIDKIREEDLNMEQIIDGNDCLKEEELIKVPIEEYDQLTTVNQLRYLALKFLPVFKGDLEKDLNHLIEAEKLMKQECRYGTTLNLAKFFDFKKKGEWINIDVDKEKFENFDMKKYCIEFNCKEFENPDDPKQRVCAKYELNQEGRICKATTTESTINSTTTTSTMDYFVFDGDPATIYCLPEE